MSSYSEKLKRKTRVSQREAETSDDNEDEEVFFLVTYKHEIDQQTGAVSYGIVNASLVKIDIDNLDSGVLNFRNKKYPVNILKRGTVLVSY
jgi:hypothetical protein